MRVVDACAGGGGKTLHLASLLEGRGQIIALDTLAWKLDELRQRARRAGVSNIETRVIENTGKRSSVCTAQPTGSCLTCHAADSACCAETPTANGNSARSSSKTCATRSGKFFKRTAGYSSQAGKWCTPPAVSSLPKTNCRCKLSGK